MPFNTPAPPRYYPLFGGVAIKAPIVEEHYHFVPYPNIDAELVAEIARHEFPASSLWKLKLEANRVMSVDPVVYTDNPYRFPTLESLLPHLLAYFSVLVSCARVDGNTNIAFTLSNGSLSYTASLVGMATQFEWSYVLEYHISYMDKRQSEMKLGNYTGWGAIDLDLYLQVIRHPKPHTSIDSTFVSTATMK